MGIFRHTILSEGAAIDDMTPALTSERRLIAMTVHVSAAPTTGENFVLELVSELGDDWSTTLYSLDLSTGSTTDILKSDFNLPLLVGDALRVTYANTDGNTIGIQLLLD